MGIYRIPPPPFVGGWQPLAPGTLPPSDLAVAVNDPPFTGSARPAVHLAILRAWIPPPPQPPVRWKLVPIEAVGNPPFGRRDWLSGTLQAWQPGPPAPQQPWKLNPVFEAVPEDQPPFGQRDGLPGIVAAWRPAPPLPWILRPVPSGGPAVEGGRIDTITLGTKVAFSVTVDPALGGRGSS